MQPGAGPDATQKPKDEGGSAKKSTKEMENIMRKVNDLEAGQVKRTDAKQKALENLVTLQEMFEEKSKELEDCQNNYAKVMGRLKEKQDKRNHLNDQVAECNQMMNGLVQATMKHSRKTSYFGKTLNGAYHIGERNAARGYSCSKESAPHRITEKDRTRLFGKKPAFGATAGSVLGQSASLPNLTGTAAAEVPSPN
mmetsp:Transcript_71627/g.126464  ORF Transcript_71627/g.126464 Transcript_71627/m.126464 type:complete len:196 (-) Transcript_71627:108-695(-)|eukprot:CAMPEP_0197653952 /NCGR_PEP_ID=MMETSP1338-20131121/37915_1 /TAXON_ID=43686 ORGANISM="Pelagodinium beii, Strain RCC1491" /NCGR_SAMPLE_ID=MMETSP1338 /ASSEMBLY_ACC=CAM_ASM_000754 /LENGTH=195 /DNA_ID=CAMNT_0043229277 /DNA_START=52 /DNA_END=639 /DNA_ORIENTATION=-